MDFHHKTIYQPPVARFLLNPNVPPLFSLAVNSFEFLPCDGTPQVECLYILRTQSFCSIFDFYTKTFIQE